MISTTLSAFPGHPTAEEIFNEVRKVLPKISLGTVYRNLDMLSSEGKIRRIETASGSSRFDSDSSDHPHFRCLSCGQIFDLPEEIDNAALLNFSLLEAHGIVIEEALVELRGFCRECKEKEHQERTENKN